MMDGYMDAWVDDGWVDKQFWGENKMNWEQVGQMSFQNKPI